MHWLDTATLCVLAGAALVGLGFGLVRPVVRLGIVAAALLAAVWLSPLVAVVARTSGGPAHPAAVVGLTFSAALLVLVVAVALIRRALWAVLPDVLLDVLDAARWLDRLAGAAVAAALAAAAVGACVNAIDSTVGDSGRALMEGSATLAHSRARFGGCRPTRRPSSTTP